MGQAGRDFMEVRIQSTMNEETWSKIPEELKEEIKHKSITIDGMKEVYRKDLDWKVAHAIVVKALKDRSKIEDEIRNNYKG